MSKKKYIFLIVVVALICSYYTIKIYKNKQVEYQNINTYIDYAKNSLKKESEELIQKSQKVKELYGTELNFTDEKENILRKKQEQLSEMSPLYAKKKYEEYQKIVDEKIEKINVPLSIESLNQKIKKFNDSSTQEQKKIQNDVKQTFDMFEKITKNYLKENQE